MSEDEQDNALHLDFFFENEMQSESLLEKDLRNYYKTHIWPNNLLNLYKVISTSNKVNSLFNENEIEWPEQRTRAEFRNSIISKKKEDLIYQLLTPKTIAKINKSNLKNEIKYLHFYNDFKSESFMIEEEYMKQFVEAQKLEKIFFLDNPYKNTVGLISAIPSNEGKREEGLVVFDSISKAIQKIFNENELEKISDQIEFLCQEFNKIKGLLTSISLEFYVAIEENISIIVNIIDSKLQSLNMDDPKNQSAKNKIISKLIKILSQFKSKRLLLRLLEFFQKQSKRKAISYVGDEKEIQNIFENPKVIRFSEIYNLPLGSWDTNLKEAFDKFFFHEPLNFDKIGWKTFINDNSFTYFLFYLKDFPCAEENLFFAKSSLLSKEFTDIGLLPLNLEKKEENAIAEINVYSKSDLLFIYYTSEKQTKFHLIIYNLKDLTFVHSSSFNIKEILEKEAGTGTINVQSIYNDESNVYVTTNVDKVVVFHLELTSKKDNFKIFKCAPFNFNNYKMLNSFAINDIFYCTDFNTNKIYYCRFISSGDNISFHSKETGDTFDNLTWISFGNNTLIKSYYNSGDYKLNFEEITHNRNFSFAYFKRSFVCETNKNNIYLNLLEQFTRYCELFGNFDQCSSQLNSHFLESMQLFAFNISNEELKSICDYTSSYTNWEEDNEYLCYFILLKQVVNVFFNTGKLEKCAPELIQAIEKSIRYFFEKNYLNVSGNEYCKKKTEVLFQISKILSKVKLSKNIITIDEVEKVVKEKPGSISFAEEILFYLIITSLETIKDIEKEHPLTVRLFNLIVSSEIAFFSQENFEALFTSNYEMIKEVIEEVFLKFYFIYPRLPDDTQNKIFTSLMPICKIIPLIFSRKDKVNPQFEKLFISISFLFKSLYYLAQFIMTKKDDFLLRNNLAQILNILIKLDKVDYDIKNIRDKIFEKNSIYEFKSNHQSRAEAGRTITFDFSTEKNAETPQKHFLITNIVPMSEAVRENYVFHYNGSPTKKEITNMFDGLLVNCNQLEVSFEKKKKNEKLDELLNLQIIPFKVDPRSLEVINFLREQENIIYKTSKAILYYLLTTAPKSTVIERTLSVEEAEAKENMKKELNNKISASKILQSISFQKILKEDEKKKIMTQPHSNFHKIITELEESPTKTFLLSNFEKYQTQENQILSVVSGEIDFNKESNKQCIQKLNKILSKKNIIMSRLGGEMLEPLITKIFAIVLKYYNLGTRFEEFAQDLSENQEEDTDFFYKIWLESSKIRVFFNEMKSQISDDPDRDLEKEFSKFFDEIDSKAKFIYSIIVPTAKGTSSASEAVSITGKIIELIKDTEFSIKELENFSKEQNDKCNYKIYLLSIINILLFALSKEENINLLLYSINKFFRSKKKKIISFLDDLAGADHLFVERVKNQFHLLLEGVESKLYSAEFCEHCFINTKINLYQSLNWKIKGRDFNVLNKLAKLFLDILEEKNTTPIQSSTKVIFNYIHLTPFFLKQKLFELFRIFLLQVFSKLKLTLSETTESKTGLGLRKQVSSISKEDYEPVLDFIIKLVDNLKITNSHYSHIILLLYKCLINQKELIVLLCTKTNTFLAKLLGVFFEEEKSLALLNETTKVLASRLVNQFIIFCYQNGLEIVIESSLSRLIKFDSSSQNQYEVISDKFIQLFKTAQGTPVLKSCYGEIILSLCEIDPNVESKILKNAEENIIELLPLFDVKLSHFNSGIQVEFRTRQNTNFKEQSIFCEADEKKQNSYYVLGYTNDTIELYNPKNTLDEICFDVEELSLLRRRNSLLCYAVAAEELAEKKDIEFKCFYISSVSFEESKNINSAAEEFLKKNNDALIDICIREISKAKCYKEKFILLKLADKLLKYISVEKGKKLFAFITPMVLEESKYETTFCSLEYLEYSTFEGEYDNNFEMQIQEEVKEETGGSSDETLSSFFNYEVSKRGLTVVFKKRSGVFKGTLINTKNKSTVVEASNLSHGHVIKDNSFYFVPELNDIDIINKNISQIKCVVCTSSLHKRDEIKAPLFLMSKENYYAVSDFLIHQKISKKTFSFFKEFVENSLILNENESKDSEKMEYFGSIFGEKENEDDNFVEEEGETQSNKLQEKNKLLLIFKYKNTINSYQLLKILLRRITLKLAIRKSFPEEEKESKISLFDIYRMLYFEFYFNLNYYNLSNIDLRETINSYLSSIDNTPLDKAFVKAFIEHFQKAKINSSVTFGGFIETLSTIGENSEKAILYGYFNQNYHMIFENILLVFYKSISKFISSDELSSFVNSFIISAKSLLMSNKGKKNEMVIYFLDKFINILFNKITNENKDDSYQLYVEILNKGFLSSLIKQVVQMIDINSFYNGNSVITNFKIQCLPLVFKYFDIAVYLLLKYEIKEFIQEWLLGNKDIFIFYKYYKIFALNDTYSGPDTKEQICLIAYYVNALKFFDFNLSQEEKNYDLEIGKDFVKLDLPKITGSTESSSPENQKSKDTKDLPSLKLVKFFCSSEIKKGKFLSIFSFDKEKNEYHLQDVFHTQSPSKTTKDYPLYQQAFLNTDSIYLSMSSNVPTQMYSFGNNFSSALGINGMIGKDYYTPQKCVGLSESTWDFGYGYNYVVALDKTESNKVFSCGCNIGAGLKSRSVKHFTTESRVNSENIFKTPIAKIATGNCNTTLFLTEDSSVYAVGLLDYITGQDKTKIPLLLKEIPVEEKVTKISVGYKNAFIITEAGNGYAIGDNTKNQVSSESQANKILKFTKKESKEFKRFIDCRVGENYFLFICSDQMNKNRLCSLGNNSHSSCGVDEKITKVKEITICRQVESLEFKKISARNESSAAITEEGALYVFGDNSKKCFGRNEKVILYPTQLEIPGKEIIFDEVEVSSTHLLAIGREKTENGYIKKVYSCGNNEHGALGKEKKNSESPNALSKFSEIKLENSENEIPIKISIGYDVSYVLYVDEKKLLENITNKKEPVSEKTKISVLCSHQLQNVDKIIAFYKSEKSSHFVTLFKAASRKIFQSFLNFIEEEGLMTVTLEEIMKRVSPDNTYQGLYRLFTIYEGKQFENNSLLYFIQEKLNLINSTLLRLVEINQRCNEKQFLREAIGNNLEFINSETRLENFKKELGKITRYSGGYQNIYIDRFRAQSFYEKKLPDKKFEETIFSQLLNSFESCAPEKYFMHDGNRLFRANLTGEFATDQGGPYREVFSNFCSELQSESLDLLIKSPNNKNNIGLLKDKFILNPNADCTNTKYRSAYLFLGRLMASAISTGIVLDLNLHPIIWKQLLGNQISFFEYETVDCLFYKLINNLENYSKAHTDEEKFESTFDLNFTFQNSAGTEVELMKGGKRTKVTLENLSKYIMFAKKKRIKETEAQINILKEGFNSVIDEKVTQILTWRQLEEFVCGKHQLDIEMLKKRTKYEDYSSNDSIIDWFWGWLSDASDEMKVMYLKFVSGRTRLPKADSFEFTHYISKLSQPVGLPHSATCFFKLKLPNYPTKEILIQKMNFAIMNCNEIDGDQ